MASPNQRGLAALARQTIADGQRLVTAQVALAKAELKGSARSAGKAGIFGAVALGSITLFTIFLLITIAYVLVELGLQVWAGFAIVTGVLLITAIVTGLLAKSAAEKINGPKAITDELEQTAKELQSSLGLPETPSSTTG
jgi:uncharacterized integral membrane protein